MKPILIHSYAGPHGGSERILLDLLHRLDRPAVLACPSGPLADHAEAIDIPVMHMQPRQLEARGPGNAARAALDLAGHGREIRSLVRDLDPALVISWGMRAAMAAVAALGASPDMRRRAGRVPIVAEHVDLLPLGKQGELARRALMACDRVVCLSAAIARDLDPAWHASGRISVVHPGVALPDTFEPIGAAQPVALDLSAIEPWKAQDTALEAVALVPGVELVLAGSALTEAGKSFEAQLKQRAREPDLAGRVHFPGTVDAIQALRDCTVLLHPTPAEPFGRALSDALASGRPVIAADAAGPREIVDETCGRLVAPGNVKGFAAALRELTDDLNLARRLGENGRLRAAELFDPEAQAERWRLAALSLAPLRSSRRFGPRRALDGGGLLPPEAVTPVVEATRTQNPPGADLSIVTVIHNSAPHLTRLLASISRHLPAAEVIVVDSGSTDGGASIASIWHGGAKVISMPDNRGYGAGCVIGLQSATRPVTGLINPDVEFVDSSIDRLVQLLADGSPDRLLSPVLIHPDGRRQDAVHPIPGSGAEALRALIPAPSMPNRLAAWMEPHRSELPTRVGWAVGASLIGRTHTLLELGPFDPDVHLYAEDLDLCLRAAERGIETWYHPEARVIHREAHSTRAAFNGEPSDLLALRRRKVVAQRLGKAVARRDDLIQTVTNLDRLALKRISRRDTSLEQSRLRAIRAARRNGS